MKKIIFVVMCVVTLFVSVFAGTKYTELSEERNTIIETQGYDVKAQQYIIKIITKDGFGRTINEEYMYSNGKLI